MVEAKIQLSATERDWINDVSIILTKNAILQKVNILLSNLHQEYEKIILPASHLPAEVVASSAKISKGENYKGLPWLVLDYPRIFRPANIFAIRTMFWWGNFLSVTLHLSGIYKHRFSSKILGAHDRLKQEGFYCGIHDDQWVHHFGDDNYISLQEIDGTRFADINEKSSFIKLANKIQLDQWDDAGYLLKKYFETIVGVLK
jgi:hypothetical protein